MRTETKALVYFFLIACIPPWIGWSLLRFGVVPADGPWQALYLTGWSASAAGLIATHIQDGPRGVGRLLRRAVRFAVPIRWWLFVLFVPPLAAAGSALLYERLSGVAVTFSPAGYLRLAAPAMWVGFFLGPFGEEFGWRGYLLPRLAHRFSVVTSVLIVGAVWAIWHWPLLYQSFVAAPGRELVVVLVGITYMSIWIGTVYLRTESLALAMLMHWNINASREIAPSVFLGSPTGTDAPLQWSATIANALVALLAIPALLKARR
jgi:uncharacterized protein